MSRRPQRYEARFEAAADSQPLADSLHALVARVRGTGLSEFSFLLQLPPDFVIPAAVEEAGYRICEAAIDNAVRHASARRVMVELSWRHEKIIVRVADDGVGFDPTGPRPGERQRGGLERMEDVARAAGGRLSLASAPGAGTCISALFALDTPPK
jgi:signal transduction histidine kinase